MKVIFLELIRMSAVLIHHHLELLNLLDTTLSHNGRKLTQIRHMIGIHGEDLILIGLSEGISSLLLVGIGLKIGDVL